MTLGKSRTLSESLFPYWIKRLKNKSCPAGLHELMDVSACDIVEEVGSSLNVSGTRGQAPVLWVCRLNNKEKKKSPFSTFGRNRMIIHGNCMFICIAGRVRG